MPDLLLEILSEEIPARMQTRAASDLQKLVTDSLVERGLLYEGAANFATPRRLALHVAGLPARQPDTREERRGPRVGAPEQALAGFLKSAGLASIEQANIEKDPKGKGEIYVAHIERPGRATIDVLADILPSVIRGFPWPKSMRWGAASAGPESLRWVRPLQGILATFGPETEDPEVVPFEVGGLIAGKTTRGHRFMSPQEFSVRRFDDYVPALEKARVVLDAARRRDIISHDARDLAFAQGLELVEDDALLEEVAGLVEWPVALMGEFSETFLEIPPEVIRATIRANQKCFVLRKPDGALSNKFILVANIVASDGGRAIAAGNGRVVRARLSDALYFWQTDQKPLPDYAQAGTLLDQRMAKLRALNIVFHEKLGTQGERVDRIKALARQIAPLVGADPALADRAAELCKADLMSEVVGEFPETQGLMGRRYAALQGEAPDVCVAIEDHYRPQGPSDRIPTNPVAIAVALADKIDTLVGFWAIDEKPTGSKDPYALRRAALGVIEIVSKNEIKLYPRGIFEAHIKQYGPSWTYLDYAPIADSFQQFFNDRLEVRLREQGKRHDLVDAVLNLSGAGNGETDILSTIRRVDALAKFLDTDDGANLLAGFKRAANILKAEEKKEADGGAAFLKSHAPSLRTHPEEDRLALETERAARNARTHVAAEDFEAAMRSLAQLRAPVDHFFDAVKVNDADPAHRLNRLRILNELRQAMNTVADFSMIAT